MTSLPVAGFGFGVPSALPAESLFPQIEEFQSLSRCVGLSEDEELALLQLPAPEWFRWRVQTITPLEPSSDKLSRRLAYAISLLRRMQPAMH